jgi:phage terminase large subunit-like protein
LPADPATGREATGWYYSNPALGDFLSIENLRAEAREAAMKPTAENSFRVFRLNQWTSQAKRWLSMAVWDRNGRDLVLRERLKGRQCVAGLDLASTSDFTAWVLLFPGSPTDPDAEGFTVLPRFWIPQTAVERRAPMLEQFQVWQREGFVTVTPGEVTDYKAVRAGIKQDAEDFRIRCFGYDPWNSTHLVMELEDGGLEAVKVQQTAARLNDPCKRLETLLAGTQLYHGGNPVLRWMADNVETTATADGLIKPSKAKSGEKIDGIAALVNSLFVVDVEDGSGAVEFISF